MAAEDYVPKTGRATILKDVRITNDRAGVVVHQAKMTKEPWCLATPLSGKAASEVVALYAKGFTIEETFRDAKDLRFGMSLRATHISDGRIWVFEAIELIEAGTATVAAALRNDQLRGRGRSAGRRRPQTAKRVSSTGFGSSFRMGRWQE